MRIQFWYQAFQIWCVFMVLYQRENPLKFLFFALLLLFSEQIGFIRTNWNRDWIILERSLMDDSHMECFFHGFTYKREWRPFNKRCLLQYDGPWNLMSIGSLGWRELRHIWAGYCSGMRTFLEAPGSHPAWCNSDDGDKRYAPSPISSATIVFGCKEKENRAKNARKSLKYNALSQFPLIPVD